MARTECRTTVMSTCFTGFKCVFFRKSLQENLHQMPSPMILKNHAITMTPYCKNQKKIAAFLSKKNEKTIPPVHPPPIFQRASATRNPVRAQAELSTQPQFLFICCGSSCLCKCIARSATSWTHVPRFQKEFASILPGHHIMFCFSHFYGLINLLNSDIPNSNSTLTYDTYDLYDI